MEQHDILRTLAEVATAFAGFTGVVVVLGGRDHGWRTIYTTAVTALLACSLGVVFFGFAPDLASAAHLEPTQAWRVSTFLFATYHLAVILGSISARKRAFAAGEPPFGPRPALPFVFAGGSFIVLAQLLTAAGFISSWLFFFYLLGLLWLLAMATRVFGVLLVDSVSSKPSA